MLIMAGRRIYPFTQPMSVKSFRVQLKTQMAIHVIDKTKDEEQH